VLAPQTEEFLMENKKLPADKIAKLSFRIDGKDVVVNDVSLSKVTRNDAEAVDVTLTGTIDEQPTIIVIPAATIASLGLFVGDAKVTEATKKAAAATGVVIGAAMQYGSNAVQDLIHGKGRGKHGPRNVPPAEKSEADETDKAA